MKTKNKIIAMIIFLLVIITVITILFINSHQSIIGEWVVASYNIDGKTATVDEVGNLYGTNYSDGNKLFSAVFNSDNTFHITFSKYYNNETDIREGTYEVKGNNIVIAGENAFTIKGDKLIPNCFVNHFDNVEVILEKIQK